MLKTLLLLIFSLSFSACKKTIPESQVKSLSGKDYEALRNGRFDESDISLVKDFFSGQGVLINEFAPVTGGMIFTLLNGDNPYGQELFFYNESTRKWKILANIDSRPFESSTPLGLKVLGTKLYFTARTEDYGREIYEMDLSTFSYSRLTDINAGGEDSVFTHYDENDDPKVELEAVDDGAGNITIYTFGKNDNGTGPKSHLLKYDVSLGTHNLLLNGSGQAVPNIDRILNVDDVIFTFVGGDIYQVSSGVLKSHGNKADSKDYIHDGTNIFYEATGLIYEVDIAAATSSSFVKVSGLNQMVLFNGNIYGIINGELNYIDKTDGVTPTQIMMDSGTASPNSDVKDLVIVNNKLCLTALNNTDTGSGRHLFCSKGTAITNKASFYSYDFNVASGSDNKVGKLISNGTNLIVSASDSTGSSVFKMNPTSGSIGTPIALMPYRTKIYGYFEQNYGVVFSFGSTVIARDEFDVFRTYHSSLTSMGTEMRNAFEDNNGVSLNGSSYPLAKFSKGNILFGNYYANIKSFWTLDINTRVVSQYEFGAIEGEPIEHNGKYYFVTSYRMLKEIVEFDPATGSARHLHPCGQVVNGLGGYTPDFCHPGNQSLINPTIKIHEAVGNNLYYTASGNDGLSPPGPSGYNLWTLDITAPTPLAEEYEDINSVGSIDDVVYYGIVGSNVVYGEGDTKLFSDDKFSPTGSPASSNLGTGMLDKLFVSNGYLVYVDIDGQAAGYLDLSSVGGAEIEFSPSSINSLNIHKVNEKILVSSDSAIEEVDFSGASPSLVVISSLSNPASYKDGFFYSADNSGGINKIDANGVIVLNYPMALAKNGSYDCDPLDLKVYGEGSSALSFYCDDLDSGTFGPAIYSKKNQHSTLLSEYGVEFNSIKDNLSIVNLDSDNIAVYSRQFHCAPEDDPCATQNEHTFNIAKLIEFDDKTGLITFALIEYEEREVIELKQGTYFSCYDGEAQFFNYSVSPVDKFNISDSYCLGNEVVVAADQVYLSLLMGFNGNEVGLELYKVKF